MRWHAAAWSTRTAQQLSSGVWRRLPNGSVSLSAPKIAPIDRSTTDGIHCSQRCPFRLGIYWVAHIIPTKTRNLGMRIHIGTVLSRSAQTILATSLRIYFVSETHYPPTPALAKAGAAPGTTEGVELAFLGPKEKFALARLWALCQTVGHTGRWSSQLLDSGRFRRSKTSHLPDCGLGALAHQILFF